MKIAAMFGNGKGGLVDKPDPKPKEDFVLVKVRAVPMCTEYKGFKSDHKGDNFGHEAAGEVAEVAQSADVGHLLYYHIVPPMPIPGLASIFLRGVSDAYDGPVTLGRDGTSFSLPAGSTEIIESER